MKCGCEKINFLFYTSVKITGWVYGTPLTVAIETRASTYMHVRRVYEYLRCIYVMHAHSMYCHLDNGRASAHLVHGPARDVAQAAQQRAHHQQHYTHTHTHTHNNNVSVTS